MSHHLIFPQLRTFLLAIFLGELFLPHEIYAQVLVDLFIQRTLYVAYEPLLVTVKITNLSGNTLLLSDTEGKKWFGFQVETFDGSPLPLRNPNYHIAPIALPAKVSLTKTVNLTQLYPISDFGSYRIRASLYACELSEHFSSPPLTVEITEGRLLWEQTVGVPSSTGIKHSSRVISLLSERMADSTELYLRIQDKEAGIVYCTHPLGNYITFRKPQILLDYSNSIHVLQNDTPNEFIYSQINLDGKILKRLTLRAEGEPPYLKLTQGNKVIVVGGIPTVLDLNQISYQMPKLSERPLPTLLQEHSAGRKNQKIF